MAQYRLVFGCENSDEEAHYLMELAYGNNGGVEILDSQRVACILETEEIPEDFILQAANSGFTFLDHHMLADTNWVQQCSDLTEPVQILGLKILPVLDIESAKKEINKDDTIKLFIGNGFGTGHHASTKLILEFLQDESIVNYIPTNTLDLGTGSGILAIAINKLYKAKVLGIDIEKSALVNAKENLDINGIKKDIAIEYKEVYDVVGQFDLIVANIYAEILTKLELEFAKRTKEGCSIILSGIMESKLDDVKKAFSHWHLIREKTLDGWSAVAFRLI